MTLLEGLSFPVGIAFDPDGTMYFTERGGRIRVVRDGELVPDPLAEIQTTTQGETGLLGIAYLEETDSVYAFATDPAGDTNRIFRVPARGGKPEIVFSGMPASPYHNGGGVVFADGMMFVSNGETHDFTRSQDPNELGGKVYRLTPEGKVPPDNPFGDSPAFAIGLRNPFGLTVDPVSGNPFVTENGPSSHDEVNRIVAGGNYGWPDISGPAEGADVAGFRGEYHDPLVDLPEIVVPTGIAFADPAAAQGEYAGDLFFGTFSEEAIHRVRLNERRDRVVSEEIVLREGDGIVGMTWGPGGLYYSTPSAIKLLPIAQKGSRVKPVTSNEGGEMIPRAATTIALLVVLGVALYLVNRRLTRRGRA